MCGVDSAGEHGEIAKTQGGKVATEIFGRSERAAGAIVDVAEPGEGETLQRTDPVVKRVGVEVGVEARGDRNIQRAGGADGGSAEWSFGGHVDEVGSGVAPKSAELAAGGEAETEERIAGDRQAGHRGDTIFRVIGGLREVGTPRTVNGDDMSASTEFAGDHAERHGDAVDFRRKGFGDESEFHKRVSREAERRRVVNNYPPFVSVACRRCYKLAKAAAARFSLNSGLRC